MMMKSLFSCEEERQETANPLNNEVHLSTKSEDWNFKMKLETALHFTIGKICQQHVETQNVSYDKKFIAALTKTTWKQCETFGQDLEVFGKHAKRSTVNSDDVKLLARRSPTVYSQLMALAETLSEKSSKKKSSKKAKISVNDNPIEIDF